MKIHIPDKAKFILDTLHHAGFEAFVVGGCVRDSLLNRQPDDWDITTNARPTQVKQLFAHTIDTGISHGTVTVMMDKEGYEVTTYRVDGKYEDHRRPTEVCFTGSLKEDMLRRDFTINAMAYNDEEGLVDHFDGQKDLHNGVIRCVGMAMDRFDEDALRVLRALRFAAQLGFTIEPRTYEAMQAKAELLKGISAERIRVELTKLLLSDHPELLAEIGYPCGITKVVLPAFDRMYETEQENPHHCYNVGMHCLKAVSYIEKDVVLRWTALLHDVGKPQTKTVDENGIAHFYRHGIVGAPMAVEIMKQLRFDNDTIRHLRDLVYWHDYNWGKEVSLRQIRRAASKINPDCMWALLKVQRADIMAQSEFLQKEKLAVLHDIELGFAQICEEGQCMTVKELALDGRDLIQAGMKPGRELGEMLKWLLEQVVEQPEWNTKERLLELVKERNN